MGLTQVTLIISVIGADEDQPFFTHSALLILKAFQFDSGDSHISPSLFRCASLEQSSRFSDVYYIVSTLLYSPTNWQGEYL